MDTARTRTVTTLQIFFTALTQIFLGQKYENFKTEILITCWSYFQLLILCMEDVDPDESTEDCVANLKAICVGHSDPLLSRLAALLATSACHPA